MANFFQGVFQTFFLISYVLLFVISVIILKPFYLHAHRRYSTMALKISYLIYLLSFLVFTYLLLFGEKVLNGEIMPYQTLFNIHFLFFLSSVIIPNGGIMLRKKVKRNRREYNLVFTLINIVYFSYLSFLIFSKKWQLM